MKKFWPTVIATVILFSFFFTTTNAQNYYPNKRLFVGYDSLGLGGGASFSAKKEFNPNEDFLNFEFGANFKPFAPHQPRVIVFNETRLFWFSKNLIEPYLRVAWDPFKSLTIGGGLDLNVTEKFAFNLETAFFRQVTGASYFPEKKLITQVGLSWRVLVCDQGPRTTGNPGVKIRATLSDPQTFLQKQNGKKITSAFFEKFSLTVSMDFAHF